MQEYFQAGVRLVWVFYPRHNLVQVYESLTAVRGLTRTDTLDGGPVLHAVAAPELIRELVHAISGHFSSSTRGFEE